MEKGEIKVIIEPDKGCFYENCLSELKSRDNWTEAFLPMLDRFVTLTAMLNKLNVGIIEDEITIEHVNKAGHKNYVTSPKWRMFLELNREANVLAKELMLSPINAPRGKVKDQVKGFDTGMKVNKTA